MRAKGFRIFALLVMLAMLVSPFGAQTSLAQDPAPGSPSAAAAEVVSKAATGAVFGVSETGLYVVQLADPAVPSYTGGIAGLAATSPQVTGERRLDASSPAVQAYAEYLRGKQSEFIAAMEQTLSRSVEVTFRYVGAMNGLAVAMSHEEALKVSQLPGVKAVFGDVEREIETDVGPWFLGAPSIWNGDTGSGVATRGEGIIVGVIDTGINFQHLSFAATDGEGYTHTNPYGAGVYHGWCATNPGFCNEKLIGAYGLNPMGGNPADDHGHGSHTASTAAGNLHEAIFNVGNETYNLTIAGMAPRANVVAYKVCTPSCPQSASVQAVEHAILDDEVDVLNYSISGTDNPWNDVVDLAFLEAFNAGIFVAASAGNSGPGPGTVAKTGPWNASVAASTINRIIAHTVDVTGPTTPPELQGMAAVPGENTVISTDLTGELRFNAANPRGCTAHPADFFLGAMALIERGDCTFATKVNNAVAAGATQVIVYNHVGGPPISMGGLTGTPAAVMVDNINGADLRDYVIANPGATVRINAETSLIYNDDWQNVVAGFSSRGPSQFEMLAPTFIAPGVNTLAAGAFGEDHYYFSQGTSMSSPHAAGAGALMMALNPTWSPAEVRSALAMTAVPELVKEDGATPASPFDIGSGLLNLDAAGRIGLVMDETYDNFVAANPAIGGDPKTLNLPSVVNYSCVGECSWTRTVTSVLDVPATYDVMTVAPAGMTVTVTPSNFTINPGATQELLITAEIDLDVLPAGAWAFADIWLVPEVAPDTAPAVVLLNESFEDTDFPPTGWTAYDLDGVSAEWVRSTLYAHSGVASAHHSWGPAGGPYQEGWLVTPPLVLDNNALLSFWERSSFAADYVYHGLMVSTGSCDPNDGEFVEIAELDGITGNWREQIFDLSGYTGETVCLGFLYEGTFADGWYVDDVLVETFEAPDTLPSQHMPVVVKPATAVLPENVFIWTDSRSGSQDVTGLLFGQEITELTSTVDGLVRGEQVSEELFQDPTNGDPFNMDGGVFYVTTEVPEGALRLVAEIIESEAPDIDLFVGTGDTPGAGTLVCAGTTPSWDEYCNIDDPAPGTWWILVQSWMGSPTQPDLVTLSYGVVSMGDAGNLTVDGPASVPAGTPFDITLNWDEPELQDGERWYGAFTLGSDPTTPDDIGRVGVDLAFYLPATVAKDGPETALPGQTITYTITVDGRGSPLLMPALLTDMLPEGVEFVEGSLAADFGTAWYDADDNAVYWIPEEEEAESLSASAGSGGAAAGALNLSAFSGQAASIPPANPADILYDQTDNLSSNGWSSQDFESAFDAYDNQAADDFVVPDAQGWTIETVVATGFYSTTGPSNFANVYFYADDGGLPGALVYSALNQPTTDPAAGTLVVNLSTPAVLPSGTYWFSLQARMDFSVGGQWYWYQRTVQSGEIYAWRNPGDGFGTGCTDWTTATGCGASQPDLGFRLEGFIGGVTPPPSTATITFDVLVTAGLGATVTNTAELDYGGTVDTAETTFTVPAAYLQVAHLAPFAEDASVTITLNGAPALTDFGYGDSTGYIPLAAGDYDVAVTPIGATDPAIEASITLAADTYYTAIAVGDGVNQDLGLILLTDDLTPPAMGMFHLRLGHLAPFAAGPATADIRLQDGTPVLLDVDFGDVTGFIPLAAGTYDLKITTPGGAVTLIDPLPVTFVEGMIISAFATGDGANQDLGVFALPAGAEGFFLPLFVEPEPEEFMIYLPIVNKNLSD